MGKQAKLRALRRKQQEQQLQCAETGVMYIKEMVEEVLKNNWYGSIAVNRPESFVHIQTMICSLDIDLKKQVGWKVYTLKKNNGLYPFPDYPRYIETQLDLHKTNEVLVIQIDILGENLLCNYVNVRIENNHIELWGKPPGAIKEHLINILPEHEDEKAKEIAYIFNQTCLVTCPYYWDNSIKDLSISTQLDRIHKDCESGKGYPNDINLSTWGSLYDLAHTNPLIKSCSELILAN
ncbi:MAG: hypothetical protein SWX82_34330 [Cyanobacteriota bacterium]|nr:hypothetical protein [Cyanobacteriota bacterium]